MGVMKYSNHIGFGTCFENMLGRVIGSDQVLNLNYRLH